MKIKFQVGELVECIDNRRSFMGDGSGEVNLTPGNTYRVLDASKVMSNGLATDRDRVMVKDDSGEIGLYFEDRFQRINGVKLMMEVA